MPLSLLPGEPSLGVCSFGSLGSVLEETAVLYIGPAASAVGFGRHWKVTIAAKESSVGSPINEAGQLSAGYLLFAVQAELLAAERGGEL